MKCTSNSTVNITAQLRDRIPFGDVCGPLTNNEDDGGDHTTEVEPDL